MSDSKKLTKKERETIRELSTFLKDLSEWDGQMFNKDIMFSFMLKFVVNLPMIHGYGHIMNIKDLIVQCKTNLPKEVKD